MARDLKESLGAALEHDRKKRSAKNRVAYGSAKQSRVSRAKGGFDKKTAKAIADAMSVADQRAVDIAVTPEAQRHGQYELVDDRIVETVHGGKIKQHSVRVIRNLGGTPIERWYARGKLDPRQMAAIMFYQSAWARWIGQPRVVANWDAVIVRSSEGAVEMLAHNRIAARESLRLLDQEVFFREPVDHFHVWQNVVIWDEPAGIAGGRVGFLHKPAEAVALLIVSGLAHKIADVVIDRPRSDFGDLILQLDAPRKPRGARK